MMCHHPLSIFLCGLSILVFTSLAQADERFHASGVTPASSQVPEPSQFERQAEADRLQARRVALEENYQKDVAICYQQFDVTSCRNKAREKRIALNAALRKEELAHSARERRIAADENQRRLEAKQQDAHHKAQETALNELAHSKKVDRTTDTALQQRNESNQRAAYEQKQREANEKRTSLDKRMREREKPPAAPLPIPAGTK